MPKKIWIGAVIISVVYAIAYEGAKLLVVIHPILKHVINFGFIIIIAFTGLHAFSFLSTAWVKRLWSYCYVAVISILIAYGLVDMWYHVSDTNLREMFSNFRMFFTSPVPYGVLVFLAKRTAWLEDGKQQARSNFE
jgi:hypothetical protein